MNIIVGAGLAGLITGSVFPKAEIFESGAEQQSSHKAVLRFRTTAVGDTTGVAFKKVKVNKGLWFDGKFVKTDIRLANLYSKKVLGKLADRSIWNLDSVERYIAPDDLIPQLIDRCGNRIKWNTTLDKIPSGAISTIPMESLAKLLDFPEIPKFEYSSIQVKRFTVEGADVYQTVYYPCPNLNVYRASITKDLLIAEFVKYPNIEDLDAILMSFGLNYLDVKKLEQVQQKFGKIAPIDEGWRRNFIYQTTKQHGIYSIGRFATWRNVLLDDIVHDAQVIKQLIQGDEYANKKINLK